MLGISYLSAENLFGNLENGKTQSWTILLMNLTQMCCLFRFIQQYIWEEFRSILLAVLKDLWCPTWRMTITPTGLYIKIRFL